LTVLILDDDIDLVVVSIAKVKKLEAPTTPARELEKLAENECFE
jgi:hypothetical protein